MLMTYIMVDIETDSLTTDNYSRILLEIIIPALTLSNIFSVT